MSNYRTTDVMSGWNYRVFIGGDKPATADRIIGGWARTEQEAEEKALEVLGRHE